MALESATPTPSPAPLTPNDPERHGIDDPAEWLSATRTRSVRRILIVVLGLNLAVAAVKLGYGLRIGSVAMSADGVQSLLDGLANVVGLVGIAIAARPPDRDHLYGHERYETLASMAIAGLMAIGVVQVVEGAIGQWRDGSRPEVTTFAFVLLLATMVVNTGVTLWERRQSQRLRSNLLAADAKHTASDILVSGAVIAGLAGERIGINGADAAVSLIVAVTIGWAAWGIVREASLVLTDATFVDPKGLLRAAIDVSDVVSAHNVRTRETGGRVWVEMHVTVDPDLTVKAAHDVATAVEGRLREFAGPATQAIVHVEPAEPPHTRPDPLFGEGGKRDLEEEHERQETIPVDNETDARMREVRNGERRR